MFLPGDGSELELRDSSVLIAEYTPGDGVPGRLSLLRRIPATWEERETTLNLDRWTTGAHYIEEWLAGGALMLCGGDRILVLETTTLEPKAALPIEYEEFDTLRVPWIAQSDELFLIASVDRVVCLDRRLAFRWTWSTRVHSHDWWQLTKAPVIEGSTVRIFIASPTQETEVVLDARDATTLTHRIPPRPRNA
jgi:hypothetical protein